MRISCAWQSSTMNMWFALITLGVRGSRHFNCSPIWSAVPSWRSKGTAEALQLSFNTVASAVNRLVDIDILVQSGGNHGGEPSVIRNILISCGKERESVYQLGNPRFSTAVLIFS